VNHPETNGMIEYFIRPLDGVRTRLGRKDWDEFRERSGLAFRLKPAGVVERPLAGGALNLLEDCRRVAELTRRPFKFTVTSPYMLAKSLLDRHYGDLSALTMDLAEILAEQVAGLPCSCLQLDEANLTGSPDDADLAARAINRVLKSADVERAVHLCFGNYGGQTIQSGDWKPADRFPEQSGR
jgi:5-methyltetrahydropteroyltriglutamate--homocysteine methyltransferase